MDFEYSPHTNILFPAQLIDMIFDHCRKHLVENADTQNIKDRKAFGLVAGRFTGTDIEVCRCFPLSKNARAREPYKTRMDQLMDKHAIRSVTPLEQRGWVADPEELITKIHQCHDEKIVLLGTYHMHRIAWDHDPVRDTPTKIDTILADKSQLIMFIVSMVKPDRPIIRAFHEGILSQEYPILPR